jgi:hypothetical protein
VSSETAPAKLTLTIKPTTIAAGAYETVVRIAATGADAKTIRAALTVKPRPRLALDKAAIAFTANLGDSVATQTVAIAGVDGSIDSLSVAKPDCGTVPQWVTPVLSASKAPATLTLNVTHGSLGAGTYSCSIGVSTTQSLVDSASQVIRATLTLRAVPKLVVSIDTVRAGTVRASDAPPSFVKITNGGTGTLSGLTAAVIAYASNGAGWLTLSLDSTTAPATLTVRPTARSLSTGTYYATVNVASSIDGIAAKTVVVSFQVTPVPSTLVAQPAQVTLTKRVNDPLSVRMTGLLTHSGDSPIQYMGFGAPAYWVFSTGAGFRVQPSMACGPAPFYPTPCQLFFDITADAGSPVGTYTFVVPYVSYYTTPPPVHITTTRFTLIVTP